MLDIFNNLPCIHEQTLVYKLVLKWRSRNRVHACRQERMLQEIYDRLVLPTRVAIRDQVSIPFDYESLWHHISLLQLFLLPNMIIWKKIFNRYKIEEKIK